MDRELQRLSRAVVAAAERHDCVQVSAEFRCAIDDLRAHLIARQESARGAPELMERALHPWAYPGLKPVGGTRMGVECDPTEEETLP